MKAVLIDHDDSFTYNLQHWLRPICSEVVVLNHRDLNQYRHADLVVLSPGPKNPQDYPQVLQFLQRLSSRTPVFGVCLGMQMMAEAGGGKIQPYSPPLHGKKSKLKILNPAFQSLDGSSVARYHSLFCSGIDDKTFETVAVSLEDNLPMWIRHREKKWIGVQFHPESFLTENADVHLKFLKEWLFS